MKRTWKIAAPALVTGGLLLLLYAWKDLFPFGSNTIAWCDMNQQVIPLLCEFKDILAGKSSLFLNLQNAGGMNFWGVFLFFISSPFSFLVAFVDKADMQLFANILVLVKMMICAGCAAFFFQKVFPKLYGGFAAALSVSYAFCGFALLFYQNMVWLDMMYLFPLFMLALWHLAKTGSMIPYALCLTAMLVVNFYLSYMLVLFLILAAGIWFLFFMDAQIRGQRVIQLAMGTFGAALCSGVVWLPALLQFLNSARGENLFMSLASGGFLSRFETIGMMILCTGILLPACLWLFCQCFGKKRLPPAQPYTLLLFLLMLIPVFVEPINRMWHTGSYQAFPGRYGYMLAFLGLCLAAILLQQEPEANPRKSRVLPWIFGAMIVATGFFALLLWNNKAATLTTYTRSLWSSDPALGWFLLFFAAAAACYAFGIFLYRHKGLSRRILAVALCGLVSLEALFYGQCFFSSKRNADYYHVAALENQIQDDGFYRVKNYDNQFDVNMVGALGYNTLNHYTSLTAEDYMHGIRKLGYTSYWMEVGSSGGTILSDALLNQKYTIFKGFHDVPEAVYVDDFYTILKNGESLPLGLVTGADLTRYESLPVTDRPVSDETVFQLLAGTDDALVQKYEPTTLSRVKLVESDGYYTLVRTSDQNTYLEYVIPAQQGTRTFYFDCFDSLDNNLQEPYYKAFSITVNGSQIAKDYPTQKQNGILKLTTRENQEIRIVIKVRKDVSVRSLGVYSVNHEAMEQAVAQMRTAQLTVGNNLVTGTASAQKGGEFLFLSLPYDEGYTALVNGKEVEISRVFDTFMALPLEEGENTIELRYAPPGFFAGVILSIGGFLFILLCGFTLHRGKVRLLALEKPATILLGVLTLGVFLVLYVMPIIVYIIL